MAPDPTTRLLAKRCGTFHNITYYAPEIKVFKAAGIPRYWNAYVGYRSAPMGRVPAAVVVAAFYNFAPVMIEDAIPSVWDQLGPEELMALRDACVDRALTRALGADATGADVARAARLARAGVDGCSVVARPLFAAHTELPWPDAPHMQLHHACTLWREHRGDSHNIALAAAELDGVECHVLLAGNGIASAAVIQKIRGWTEDEWAAAAERLMDRGLIDGTGRSTPEGRERRAAVEAHTDRLAGEPVRRLGPERAGELAELLEPLVAVLVGRGPVSPTWPPKTLDALPHRPGSA